MTLIFLFISGLDVNTLNQKSNYCIEALNQSFIVNRFQVNVDKTNIMVFPKNKANDISVKLSEITITKVEHCRYLGKCFDEILTWTHHIDSVYSKLMKYVRIFYKVRNKLPLSVLRNIYYSFVYPHILYGIEIYANRNSIH